MFPLICFAISVLFLVKACVDGYFVGVLVFAALAVISLAAI